MLDFINHNTKFFIYSPPGFASGGPELLHQLAFALKQAGKNVWMYYPRKRDKEPVHPNYVEYELPYVRALEDDPSHVLIIPEAYTQIIADLKATNIILWWLSIDNHFFKRPGIKGNMNKWLLKSGSQNYRFMDRNVRRMAAHLVQSQYAEGFLSDRGLRNIYALSDYLHQSFLKIQTDLSQKKNIVVYNPKKGLSFTKRLMKAAPNIEFVPIQNMTRADVVKLLQSAKVYIDFGHHPGKDRIPREAATLGCCVITNTQGSAANEQDLPISEDFKFPHHPTSIQAVIATIERCFDDFENQYQRFDHYRETINAQEAVFYEQLNQLFIKQ